MQNKSFIFIFNKSYSYSIPNYNIVIVYYIIELMQ